MSEARRALDREIIVYRAPDGGPQVEVVVDAESVWLTQRQMAGLFSTSTDNVGLHIKNVYDEGELEEVATTEDSSAVHQEGQRQVRRRVRRYSLDVIISVGYRVKSRRATQFRIWATNVLRQHLIDGVTINQKRLDQRGRDAERALAVALETLRSHQMISGDGQEVLSVVQRYLRSWELLRAYDEDTLPAAPDGTTSPFRSLTIEIAREAIRTLADDMAARGETLGLFGQERGDALESILDQLEQSVFGQPAYPSVESRAAISSTS